MKKILAILLASSVLLVAIIGTAAAITDADKDNILKTGEANYETWKSEHGQETALTMLVNWLKEQPGVTDVTALGTNVEVVFEDSSDVVMLLEPMSGTYEVTPLGKGPRELCILPDSTNAVILDPCYWHLDGNIASVVAGYLTSAGYTVTTKTDDAAGLSFLTNLDDNNYGVIYYRGHGGIVCGYLWLTAGDKFTSFPPPSGYAGTRVFLIDSYYHYAFNKIFVETYCHDVDFPKTLMHMEACHGAELPEAMAMKEAFTGAYSYSGWDETVSLWAGDGAANVFFDYLTRSQEYDVAAAIKEVEKASYSPDPYFAHARLVALQGSDEQLIPEFTTIAIPVAAVLGIVFFMSRRKTRRAG